MPARRRFRLPLQILPLLAAGLVASCDTPQKQALRDLAAAGVEPNGKALVEAAGRRDARIVELLLMAKVHTEQRDTLGRTPLRIAVDQRDAPTAGLLLGAGAGVNAATPDRTSVLGAAVATGETGLIETLVLAGANADGQMPGGEKILPWAIREGRLELVRMMMRAGADPHQKDRQGTPLLHLAIESGHRDVAEALITLGADPGAINAAGEGLVHLAMRRGWTDFIRPLTKAGADPNAPDPTGNTPLQSAVRRGDRSLATLLLDCGADAEAAGVSGIPPLIMAVRLRNIPLCGLLLDFGARPSTTDANGGTALSHAVALRETGLMNLLLRPAPGRGPDPAMLNAAFSTTATARWPEGMRALVAAGANPDTQGEPGHRPLERACATNDREMAAWLLGLGADPARRDAAGTLAVERAAAAGRGSLAKLLLDYGSPAGRSLHDACARGDRGMARLLIACGVAANPEAGPLAEIPLMVALRAGDDGLAVMLAQAGGTANQRLPEGQTTLHLAIAKGCHRTVKCLLDAGANPNHAITNPVSDAFLSHVDSATMRRFLRNDRNLTPLMLAAGCGEPKTVTNLLQAGAKRNVWSRVNHFWPINFAAVHNDVKTMRAMLGRDPEREERRIVISLSAQNAVMYDGAGGEIFRTKVSTGRKGYTTRTGEFAITDKNRTWTSTIYHASMPYFQRLSCSDFGLHQGYVPGYPASHGCIRVPAGKAAELFRLTETGDRVQIVP